MTAGRRPVLADGSAPARPWRVPGEEAAGLGPPVLVLRPGTGDGVALVHRIPPPGSDEARALDPSVLDASERARAARLRTGEERDRYVTAHLLLRRVVAEHLGVTASAVRLGRAPCPRCGGPHGRPVLAGRWAGAVEVSLSHAGAHVMVALAPRAAGTDAHDLTRSPAGWSVVDAPVDGRHHAAAAFRVDDGPA